MKKKLLFMFLVLMLILCSGCGKSADVQNQDLKEDELPEKEEGGEFTEENNSEENISVSVISHPPR